MPAGIGYGLDARRRRGGFNRKPRLSADEIAKSKIMHDERMEAVGGFTKGRKAGKPKRKRP